MSNTQLVVSKLEGMYHPKKGEGGGNLISSGTVTRVQESGQTVEVFVKLDESYRELKRSVETKMIGLKDLEGHPVKVTVRMESTAKESSSNKDDVMKGLSKVRKIIAVSSCKGGVGKSTVSVNLAFALGALGQKVGVFDSDIYGPSLPSLVSVGDSTVRKRGSDGMLIPIECNTPWSHPVKLMSFGYVRTGAAGSDPASGLAAMRGPMATQVVTDLVGLTDWSDLDYLIIDMPPGTGDINLTLCQNVRISAAVIVTTPQRLALVDVVKGVAMFDKVRVCCVAMVENMSEFECRHCGNHNHPFGKGLSDSVRSKLGIETSFELPMDEKLCECSDTGNPMVMSDPHSRTTQIFMDMARTVMSEVDLLDSLQMTWAMDVTHRELKVQFGDAEFTAGFRELRKACQGESMVRGEIPEDIRPEYIERKGNYAFLVKWSDSHTSLYSFDSMRRIFNPGSSA